LDAAAVQWHSIANDKSIFFILSADELMLILFPNSQDGMGQKAPNCPWQMEGEKFLGNNLQKAWVKWLMEWGKLPVGWIMDGGKIPNHLGIGEYSDDIVPSPSF
jgi:hypothetical protein